MGVSFLLDAAVKKKKKKLRSKVVEFQGNRRRSRSIKRVVVTPDSKLSGIEKIPNDLLMAILLRLPPKVLTSLIRVSKRWYSLIFSRHFTNIFLASPSSAKPLRSIVSLVSTTDFISHAFISTSSLPHVDHSDTSLSIFDQILDLPKMTGYFVNALRGLLCVKLGSRRVRICNLTTNQRVVLPIICSQLLAEPNHDIWTSFGYDPIQDEYKVFNIISVVSKKGKIVRSEHQVLVLGPQASWRNTKGHTFYHHRPDSKGIFIKDVFYYRVRLDKNKCAIMSFDFNSEDFKLIELPVETDNIWRYNNWSSIMN